MADLISILGQAANGLGVFRAATATAGHNLQNVNTPGYSRQRVEPATQSAEFIGSHAFLGRGVMLGGITQARDAFLERQIPAVLGGAAQYTAESGALDALNVLNPNSTSNLNAAMAAFYSNLRLLSQNPSDMALRASVVGAAQDLARSFGTAGDTIEEARTGIDVKIETGVDEVNQVSAHMASLNIQIAMARARGAEPNDLLDERLRARDRLAELTGAAAVPDSDGNLSMVLDNGTALVSGGEHATLSILADGTNLGHVALQITRIGAQLPDSLINASGVGGEIRGLFDARDNGLKKALDGLDNLAFDLGTAVNVRNAAGFTLTGAAGGNFFTLGVTAAGAARSITIDAAMAGNPQLIAAAASATTIPGDATNLHAIIATERTALSGGLNASQSLSKIVSDFGFTTRSARALADQNQGIADHLNGLREGISGVSIDEELIAMTQAQRAFEAVTKVITVTDGLLGTLMELKQ